eukprot:TRINITY_DN8136_c0_g2_i1.p1 TRINITY_DN8136_c0_g2~~TRINITY_DN8136_c0_g2_i1.p1  ORF type:complete len:491 (+),score=78.93 TRINITY_DN8136_c0_g2_i1:38-1510(+)
MDNSIKRGPMRRTTLRIVAPMKPSLSTSPLGNKVFYSEVPSPELSPLRDKMNATRTQQLLILNLNRVKSGEEGDVESPLRLSPDNSTPTRMPRINAARTRSTTFGFVPEEAEEAKDDGKETEGRRKESGGQEEDSKVIRLSRIPSKPIRAIDPLPKRSSYSINDLQVTQPPKMMLSENEGNNINTPTSRATPSKQAKRSPSLQKSVVPGTVSTKFSRQTTVGVEHTSDYDAAKLRNWNTVDGHPFRHLVFSTGVEPAAFKKHIALVYRGVVYATKSLRSPSESFIKSKQVTLKLEQREGTAKSKILFLDLDETLVHTCTLRENPEIVLNTFDDSGVPVKIAVKTRPYLMEFLKKVSKVYDIVLFTAAADYYATAIVNYFDPNRQYILDMLTRKNCMETKNGFFLKDLRIVKNLDLKNAIIVDNLTHSFGFQLENGFPILEWIEDQNDVELKYLTNYLLEASKSEDLRTFNKEKLRLHELALEREDTILLP